MSKNDRKKESEQRTTVSISRSDYERLLDTKKKLQKDPEHGWLATAGLGTFIGFILTVASRSPEIQGRLSLSYFRCRCGKVIDLKDSPRAFSCSCGISYIQQQPAHVPRHQGR